MITIRPHQTCNMSFLGLFIACRRASTLARLPEWDTALVNSNNNDRPELQTAAFVPMARHTIKETDKLSAL